MRGHNEGTIGAKKRRHKDGTEYDLWVVKVSLPDGRRWERSSTDRKKAEGYLKEALRLAGRGVIPRSRLTVAAFLEGWLADVQPTVRPQTYERYAAIVKHLDPIGFIPLQQLRPGAVNKLLATKTGRTAQLCREVLRNALNDALRERLVEFNAGELARPPKHTPRKANILTREQLQQFLEATASDRLHALFMLAATTGMREGELLGLAWDDVDETARTVTVRSQLVRLPGEWVLAEPKTAAGKRTIAIPSAAAAALRVHRRRMAAERRADWQYWRLVFPTPDGQPMYGWRVVQRLRAFLADLEISTPLRLHELRHGLATYMKADGVPDEALAAYLGHSTTRLIERYAHAEEASDRQIAERMGARI